MKKYLFVCFDKYKVVDSHTEVIEVSEGDMISLFIEAMRRVVYNSWDDDEWNDERDILLEKIKLKESVGRCGYDDEEESYMLVRIS